jgi:hypothetical protein
LNKASNGPSIYTCNNDTDLINITNRIASQSYTSATQCLVYYLGQNDKLCANIDYPSIVTNGLVLNLDAGFVPSYPRSGTTWSDISLSGNNGTLTNGPTFNSGNGGSIVFDGTNDYAIFTRPSSIVNGGSISISLWAKWTTVGTTISTIQVLIDNNHNASPAQGFVIQDRPDLSKKLSFSTIPNTSPVGVLSTFQVGDGSWRHIVCTNDTVTSRLYINGILNNSASEGPILSVQPNISVGYWQLSSGRYLNGNVSQVSIYNRVLSESEVLQNYNATKARFGL